MHGCYAVSGRSRWLDRWDRSRIASPVGLSIPSLRLPWIFHMSGTRWPYIQTFLGMWSPSFLRIFDAIAIYLADKVSSSLIELIVRPGVVPMLYDILHMLFNIRCFVHHRIIGRCSNMDYVSLVYACSCMSRNWYLSSVPSLECFAISSSASSQ